MTYSPPTTEPGAPGSEKTDSYEETGTVREGGRICLSVPWAWRKMLPGFNSNGVSTNGGQRLRVSDPAEPSYAPARPGRRGRVGDVRRRVWPARLRPRPAARPATRRRRGCHPAGGRPRHRGNP